MGAIRVDVVGGKIWEAHPRERTVIWEESVKRRTPQELHELISDAIVARLDKELTAMAFKGSKPDKGKGSSDVLEQYKALVMAQSAVIHALAAALGATEEVEEDEDEDEGEEKEES